MSKQQIVVPDGLKELLQDFAIAVIKKNPPNLVDFAFDYFKMKKESTNNIQNGEVTNKQNEQVDDEKLADFTPGAASSNASSAPSPAPAAAPQGKSNRRAGVAAESFDPNKIEEFEKVVIPKSNEQRERLFNSMKNILLFKSLDEEQLQAVIDCMFERKVVPNEKVITEGEDGDNFYVIETGTYDIFKVIDGTEKKVASYDNKGSFGELALMYNTPRAATIVSTENGILWAMTRDVFRNIVLTKAFEKRRMYECLLEQVPLLSALSTYERTSVADALFSKTFEIGEMIIKQGEAGSEMYFIEEGEVVIKIRDGEENGEEKQVVQIKEGAYFGELALITQQPRAASAYAKTKVKLAVLDVESFERLLGPCLEILKRNAAEYSKQMSRVFGSKEPE